MLSNVDLKDLLNWYTQENKTMEFKDRLMVRGAGLIWIPLFFASWIFLIVIILSGNIFKQFTPLSIVLPATLLLVLGIIFSIIEINRIRVLRKYNQYIKTRFEEFKKQYNDKVIDIQGNLGELNNLFLTLRYQCKEYAPPKDKIWDWDWDELLEKIDKSLRGIMNLKIN